MLPTLPILHRPELDATREDTLTPADWRAEFRSVCAGMGVLPERVERAEHVLARSPEPVAAPELLDILLFPLAALDRPGPAIGVPKRVTWEQLAAYLSSPKEVAWGPGTPYASPNDAKRIRGGWVAGEWRGGHRASEAFVQTRIMTVDVDAGAVARTRKILRNYRCIIHSTYKSTAEAPRCRIVLLLAQPCTSTADYKRVHEVVRANLASHGLTVDNGASDASRLNYGPLHQPGHQPEFEQTYGAPLPLSQVLAASPRRAPGPRPTWNGQMAPEHYRDACLRNAYKRMATAQPNDRHTTLFSEARGLARPDLMIDDTEIEALLFPLFIRQAGHERRAEALRTIRNGIDVGRGQKGAA